MEGGNYSVIGHVFSCFVMAGGAQRRKVVTEFMEYSKTYLKLYLSKKKRYIIAASLMACRLLGKQLNFIIYHLDRVLSVSKAAVA